MDKQIKANVKLSARYFPKKKQLSKIDTVRNTDEFTNRHNVLMDAFQAWTNGDDWRKQASRNEMYVFGDQWGDRVKDPDGCGYITEESLIRRQGNQPLKNNRLRVIVRSILGVYSSTKTEPVCVARTRKDQGKGEIMSATLQYVYQRNKLQELNRRSLEYMLLSGVPAFRIDYGWKSDTNDVWVDMVNYNDFFFDTNMKDPRHEDCHLVGQIWDLGLWDVKAMFANGSKERAGQIENIYAHCTQERLIDNQNRLTADVQRHKTFFIPDDQTKCRVIEVWRKEAKERLRVHDYLTGELYKVEIEEQPYLDQINQQRIAEQSAMNIAPEDMKLLEYEWFIDNYWYFYYLTPTGEVLKEGETPYWHKSHPFAFKIYPFYNGRVYPFVSDFLDQQRYINRLIMLQDFVIRASAKGVLMFPETLLGDMTKAQVMDEWVKYNGVIFYTPKPGVEMPRQVTGQVSQLGITDMLSIQLRLLEDISGVQGALQGHAPKAGTPASLYAQETANATTTLIDLMESFKSMLESRDWKIVKTVQQCYTEPRYVNSTGSKSIIKYDPAEVRNAEFDLSIGETTATPAFRTVMDNFLMQLFQIGAISVEEMLENTSMPFADKLLQSIRSRQAEAQEQGAAPADMQGVLPPELQQQLNAQINPMLRNELESGITPKA